MKCAVVMPRVEIRRLMCVWFPPTGLIPRWRRTPLMLVDSLTAFRSRASLWRVPPGAKWEMSMFHSAALVRRYRRLPGVGVPPHHRTASLAFVVSRAASSSSSRVYRTGTFPSVSGRPFAASYGVTNRLSERHVRYPTRCGTARPASATTEAGRAVLRTGGVRTSGPVSGPRPVPPPPRSSPPTGASPPAACWRSPSCRPPRSRPPAPPPSRSTPASGCCPRR